MQGGEMLLAESLKMLFAELAMTGASLAKKVELLLLAELCSIQPSILNAVPLKKQFAKQAMSGASLANSVVPPVPK